MNHLLTISNYTDTISYFDKTLQVNQNFDVIGKKLKIVSKALKLTRVMLLILTAIFNLWSYIAGLLLMLLIICTTKTVTGRRYIFPSVPFNKCAFTNLFIRRKISKKNTE